ADAVADGHGAVLWDAESAMLCRAIVSGLRMPDEHMRFRALATATEHHFSREQAIFTHHIASRSRTRKLPAAKSIPAPVIERGKLAFRAYPLPAGFDFRDHDARVET